MLIPSSCRDNNQRTDLITSNTALAIRSTTLVNKEFRVLRAVLNHAVEDELIDVAPKLRVLKGANVRKWVLPVELEEKYLNACTEPLRTVAIIMLDAGLRPDECFRLCWENVRFVDKKRAVIVVPGTKTEAAARPVPMTPRVRAILEHRWAQAGTARKGWVFPAKRAEVGHIVDNTVYEPHNDAVEKSGICEPQFVLYSLRHTCLTRWGDSGMDAWTLARLAGHSNIRQSMVYVHPSDKALHAAIDRMTAAANGNEQGGDEIRDNEQMLALEADHKFLVNTTK
jgi:integrase